MEIRPGVTLLHYHIVDKLGEGGMGVVWRATDTSLGREVALKVLPAAAATDGDRLARFEREAKLLASLNHAHIAAIHGLHCAGDVHFLTMEMVAGEDLATRLHAGPLPLEAALRIGRQLAGALGAAHAAGVVHRDLKPANIRITPAGDVKVLDFGLAKALAQGGGEPTRDPALSPTLTSAGTMAGVILGTAAYMAPEQARGQEVDRRADIWAFGVVLYEMLTGTSLFAARTVSDTLAAVLTREPDWTAVPPRVRGLLRACLQKEPEERLRDIGDAWLLLRDERDDPPGAAAPRSGWPALVGVATLAAVVTAVAFAYLRPAPATPPMLQFLEHPPGGGTFVGAPLPSPDGTHLAMRVRDPQGSARLWVRALGGEAARAIDGTDDVRHFTWSPDGSELLYYTPAELRRVRSDGGGTRQLASSLLAQAFVWTPGDDIYVASFNEIRRLSASGGEARTVASTPGQFRDIALLPGPRLLVLQFGAATGIFVADLPGGELRGLLPGVESRVRFLPPDRVLYAEDRTLLMQRIDPERATVIGEPITIAAGVAAEEFEVAAGVLSYLQGGSERTNLTWFDRLGNVTSTSGPEAEYREVYLSPRGDRVVYVAADPVNGNRDLWVQDLAGGPPNRLTSSTEVDHMAVFSPDGEEILWEAHAGTGLLLMRRPVDGSSPAALVREWNRGGGPSAWSSDGRYILYTSDTGSTRRGIWAVPMDGEGEPVSLIDTEFDDDDAHYSPDGRWVAYSSDVTGEAEIYLQRVDGAQLVGGPQRISTGGGRRPRWRADGGELFFLAGTLLMACETRLDAERPAGPPSTLFDLGERQPYPDYAVAPDGQSFLAVTTTARGGAARPATVILNWRPQESR